MSVGKSGGQKLPVKDERDMDIFIFCTQLPSVQERRAAIENANAGIAGMTLHETGGRFWGVCDFIQIQEHGLCLMYFTVRDMDAEIETVLNGSRLYRERQLFLSYRTLRSLFIHVCFIRSVFGYAEKVGKLSTGFGREDV